MKVKRVALVTRDCAGVNPCIRSIVRCANEYGIEIIGAIRGYDGLMTGDFLPLYRHSVSGIINQGGTILKTSRSSEFRTPEGKEKALQQLKANNIDALIVIGGNGSLTGAQMFHSQCSFPVIGIPATIDNDINGVVMSIGTDTAVNVALDALDKIRDTGTSLERIFVVEVMGRDCGYLALRVALAGGAEEVIIPEHEFSIEKICADIEKGRSLGKMSWIIIVAEGKAHAPQISQQITEKTGFETRATVLGHIQRGGRPTAFDRILAARYGYHAVEYLRDNQFGICVSMQNNQMTAIPLTEAIQPKEIKINEYYRLIRILT